MKLAVYTAIFTDDLDYLYGDVIPYEHDKEGVDYICYTNSPHLKSNFWEIRQLPIWRDGRWTARQCKTKPHELLPEYDAWLWMDNSIYFTYDPISLMKNYLENHDIAVHKHSDRNCIYEEVVAAVQRPGVKRDDPSKIIDQGNLYRKNGYPEMNGLFENGILLRLNNKNVIKFNELWFKETSDWNTEDQISFAYSLWKMPEIKLNAINKTFIAHQQKNPLEQTNEFATVPRSQRRMI
tara:strand:- start:7891 stop:8601 length:711 start_codon:yes stop_codon:yes gene_type:complete